MSYRIYWDEQHSGILHTHLTGEVDWEEYNRMIDAVATEVGNIDTPVYLILQADAPQPHGNPFPHFRRAINMLNEYPQLQLAVSVDAGMATFLRVCLDVIVKVYSPKWTNKIPFVKTMPEALAIIENHRGAELKKV